MDKKEQRLLYHREYYARNKAKILENKLKSESSEERKEQRRTYYETNKERIRAHYNEPEVRTNRLQKCKEYNIKHKDSRPSRAEYQRNYRLKKKQESPPKPPKQIKAKKVPLKSKKIRYIQNQKDEPDDLIISE